MIDVKKKVVLMLLPLVLVVVGVGLLLFVYRGKTVSISVSNWNGSGEFELCDIETTYYEMVSDSCWFIPKDEEAFVEFVTNHEGYLGDGNFPWNGIMDNPSQLLYYNNGIFAVMRSLADYVLTPCMTYYRTVVDDTIYYLQYPSPGEWRPERSVDADLNEFSRGFEFVFGTYEEAMTSFYGYFDAETVYGDPENQTITVAVYDIRNEAMCQDRKVVIDFVSKTVYEVMTTE